jgi:cytochrome b pre-mRNA-processing protein 3
MNTASRTLRKPPGGGRNLLWRFLVGLFIVALAAAFLWSMDAERRAIAHIDPAERREIYERSLGELQILCGTAPRGDALEKRCLEQVQFILKFPECDARCEEIARSHMPRPTK